MEWTPIVDAAYDAAISVGTITSTGNVTIQLKDYAGNNLKEIGVVAMYITSDAAGLTTSTVASATASTGIVHEITAGYAYQIISETDGSAVVTLDGTTNCNRYMHVVLPHGRLRHSKVITFTS